MVSTRPVRIQMFGEQKRKCWFCGRFCWFDKDNKVRRNDTQFTVEHIYPKVLGGQNTFYNLVGACYGCNSKRGSEYSETVDRVERTVYRQHKHLITEAQRIVNQHMQKATNDVRKAIRVSKLSERDKINERRDKKRLK